MADKSVAQIYLRLGSWRGVAVTTSHESIQDLPSYKSTLTSAESVLPEAQYAKQLHVMHTDTHLVGAVLRQIPLRNSPFLLSCCLLCVAIVIIRTSNRNNLLYLPLVFEIHSPVEAEFRWILIRLEWKTNKSRPVWYYQVEVGSCLLRLSDAKITRELMYPTSWLHYTFGCICSLFKD